MQSNQSSEQRINRIINTILTENDRKVFAIIRDHPSTKKDLTNRTKFPSNIIDKITNELSKYNLVKKIKRPENKSLNVWVTYDYVEEEESKVNQQEKDDLFALIAKKEEPTTVGELQKQVQRKGINVDNLELVLSIMEGRGQIHRK